MKAVNLIPGDQRRATPTGSQAGGAYVVLGVLAVLLVMAVAYVLTSNGVNDKTSKAEQAGQQADALEAQASQLNAYTDFASIKEQRLAAVATAAKTRFDWERLMREVSRVMPKGSWLQTTQASVTPDSATAAAVTPTPAAAPTGPQATFVGCTPKQSEVAKILVRLRAMHRVTDVELNQSLREQAVSDVTVDSCGRLYKFDVTVTFAPLAVEEAPQGSKSVPASLGGGS
jgi:type II secretory pathway pseudopilin PulG